jgi:hypothetical protein
MEDQTIVDGAADGEVATAAPEVAAPTTTELQTQIANLISNNSRTTNELREELKQEREINALVTKHGDDSDEVRDYRAKQKVQGEITKANLNAAEWQMRVEHPDVPKSVYEGLTSSMEMELAAFKYEAQNKAPVATREPVAPGVVTAGNKGGASLALGTSREIEAAYSKDPGDPVIKEAYRADRKKRGI